MSSSATSSSGTGFGRTPRTGTGTRPGSTSRLRRIRVSALGYVNGKSAVVVEILKRAGLR